MNLFRRIFGRTSESWEQDGSSRRYSHVTPNSSRLAESAPKEEAAPMQAVEETPLVEEMPKEESAPEPEMASVAEAVPDATEAIEEKIARPVPRPSPRVFMEPAIERPAAAVVQPPLNERKQPLSYGVASDVGLLRDNNEDACFAMQWHSKAVDNRPDLGLFAVADGMGGHLDGEKAASIAVHTMALEMLQTVYLPILRSTNAGRSATILESLAAACEKANLAVIDKVPGGGTTLSTAAVIGNVAYLVHVGDSRAYLIHGGKIEQLTTDHTLVQRLLEMRELTPEEAEYYPQKNVLYRAIGQNEQLKVERLARALPPSSQVLVCSDGLWDLVDDDMIKRVALQSPTPQAACDRLVELANERGGADNVSVILIKIPGE